MSAINIEQVGEDSYCFYAKGHHDPHEFMSQMIDDGMALEIYPLGMPYHTFAKIVPTRNPDWKYYVQFSKEKVRGGFPVTVCEEAYGDEMYLMKIAEGFEFKGDPIRAAELAVKLLFPVQALKTKFAKASAESGG